jgi:hypothetical protein
MHHRRLTVSGNQTTKGKTTMETAANAVSLSSIIPQAAPIMIDGMQALRSVARTFDDAQQARLSANNRLLQVAAGLAGIDALKRDLDKTEEEKNAALCAEAKDKLVADYDALIVHIRAKQVVSKEKAASAAVRKSVAAAMAAAGITDLPTVKLAVEAAQATAKADRVQFDMAAIRDGDLIAAAAEAELPNGILLNAGSQIPVVVMLARQCSELAAVEQRALKALERALDSAPIWTEYLASVKGVGPSLAGQLICAIDIRKAQYPSSLWKLAGLDVAGDGRGRSRRKEHLTEVSYVDKEGNAATRIGLGFNPDLKTACYLAATSFLKIGADSSPFAKAYYDYKLRMENHAVYGAHNDGKEIEGKGKVSKGRRHMMAMRYAQKRFLVELYKAWRTIEGLPVAPEYSEAKLAMKHGSAEKYSV